jgi:hypothetical protein
MRKYRVYAVFAAVLGVLGAWPPATRAQRSRSDLPEVRHLVTMRFKEFVPFGARPSLDTLLELIRETPGVLRLRGYREAESADPFDVILVSSYRGLDGFEQATAAMLQQRTRTGDTLSGAYRRIDEVTAWHRDQFVEMIEDLEHDSETDAELLVFEWVRLVPAAHPAYELLLRANVLPWEREFTRLRSAETGRMLIGDEWDYLRVFGFQSLAAYHDYRRETRDHVMSEELGRLIAARKTFVVREDKGLAVR